MSTQMGLVRELLFLRHARGVLLIFAASFFMASYALWSGLADVAEQNREIDQLIEADAAERIIALADHGDYGGVAYYSYHLTYSRPSKLAFTAMGMRDVSPWKHRIRMLALEGQIYEADVGNPEIAALGRFDYNFLLSYVLPLLVIMLLYGLRSTERDAGRYNLLQASAGTVLWRQRATVRLLGLYICLATPFAVIAAIYGISAPDTLFVLWVVAAHIALWAIVSYVLARTSLKGPTVATMLVGLWLLTAIIAPALCDQLLQRYYEGPDGGDITLTQREAVNDAWDLPKQATMQAFIARHPEWADAQDIAKPFEWKWYFAFQQVGDQKVEALSMAYRKAMEERDRAAALAAWFMPPALVRRALAHHANTDLQATMAYQAQVRRFHAELRAFYYPLLFSDQPFTRDVFAKRPEFSSEFTLAAPKVAAP